jgi:hypothetical protein
MSLLSDIRTAASLASTLRPLLRERLSLEQARDLIRRRLEDREANFLALVDRGIFRNPSSPYRPLLAHAGCAFADLARMVRTRGLEPTLLKLRHEGVYVTFEEFKGRAPITRHGRTFEVSREDFVNPGHRPHIWRQTSGTTGPAATTSSDLSNLAGNAAHLQVSHDALGLTGAPLALWRGMLPASAGLSFVLAAAAAGNAPRRWFTPLAAGDLTSSRKYPLANASILTLARLYGVRVPWPEYVPFERALVVARWASDALKSDGRCFLSIQASAALRMCLAAMDAGLDLKGATISGGGEPMTAAKAGVIRAAGVICRQNYYTSETGAIGRACGQPSEEGDVHLLEDSLVLVQATRQVPGSSVEVDAFNLTTLLAASRYILLNVEFDDYGIVEERSCGCPLEQLGLRRHIRGIRSFRKLTGEGVTLVGSDMERVLTEVLPARFGGTPLDYQLVEDEDPAGFTRLRLTVSPRVRIDDETRIVEVVMQELAASGAAADHARASWQQARTLEIIRKDPSWTAAGKFLPLHLANRDASPRLSRSSRRSA